MFLQEQCFWNNQKLMPLLNESAAMYVGFVLSKIWTRFSISNMIFPLDSSNNNCSCSSQQNGVLGFNSSWNGSIYIDDLIDYRTYSRKQGDACNFSEKGQKRAKKCLKIAKKSKIFENLGKNLQNLKIF